MISMREKQKTEAAMRLELMGVREDVRQKFEEDGTVMICIDGRYRSIDRWVIEAIRHFEWTYDATVFLVLGKGTVAGSMYELLFVGNYEEEWEEEREAIRKGFVDGQIITYYDREGRGASCIFFRTTEDGGIV